MSASLPQAKVMALMGFMHSSGFYNVSIESYARAHALDPPALVSIRGPGGRQQSGWVTSAPGGMHGVAAPYGIDQSVVWVLPRDFAMVSVGSAQGNDVSLPLMKHVSKFHASLRRGFDGKGLFLYDQNSRNGTALVEYADRESFVEDLDTERYEPLPAGGNVPLEDRIVIELAGRQGGIRFALFTEYSSLWTYLNKL